MAARRRVAARFSVQHATGGNDPRGGRRLRPHRPPDAGARGAPRRPRTTWPRRCAGPRGAGSALAPRGRGHSTFGRSQVEGGVVADMSALRRVGRGRGRPGGGRGGRDVERGGGRDAGARPDAAGAPRLPRAVGRRHAGRRRRGRDDLDVRRGERQRARAGGRDRDRGHRSRARRATTLFDAVRAGLGQVGVVTRATLRLTRRAGVGARGRAVVRRPRDDAGGGAAARRRRAVRRGAGRDRARSGGRLHVPARRRRGSEAARSRTPRTSSGSRRSRPRCGRTGSGGCRIRG